MTRHQSLCPLGAKLRIFQSKSVSIGFLGTLLIYIQGLFSKSILGAETGHFGLISVNFDPFYEAYLCSHYPQFDTIHSWELFAFFMEYKYRSQKITEKVSHSPPAQHRTI